MKKNRFLCCLLSVVVLTVCLPLLCLAETPDQNDMAVSNGSHSIDAAAAFLGTGQIVEKVQAAFMYEVNSDTLMYAWNPDVQVYPSSLVKILTALIAVEQGDPQDVITVTEEVLETVPYDAVSAELQPGEQISLQDLLYCMMTGSANDAAAVIADHIAGNQTAFIQKMNEYAQELGCTGTQFTNVHGLHDKQQYTTARDMARILSAAVKNESFNIYFSASNYTVPATNRSEERELSSGNFLINTDNFEIYYDERVTGGRTGITEDGKRCMAAAAQSNGLHLISIVMGAESVFTETGATQIYGGFVETTTLFDAGFDGYKASQILYDGQILRQKPVMDGTSDVMMGCRNQASAVLPSDVTVADLTYKYTDIYEQLQAPVQAGEKLSSVQVWYGGICVAQADLYAMNTVHSLSKVNNENQMKDAGTGLPVVLIIILWVLAASVIIASGVLLACRLRFLVMRKRSKKYRRSRRRSR